MLDYLFGLLLFGLGLNHPTVLGEATPSRQLAQLKLMRPKFTPEEEQAFQKDRAKREANLKHLSESRVKEYQQIFKDKYATRTQKDDVTRDVLEAKASEFTDSKKREKLLSLSRSFQSTVTAQLSGMQKKLESMIALLDRITAASGALKAQGTDVSQIETDIAAAQSKVTTALALVSTMAESLPTSFSVSGEEGARDEVLAAIASVKSQLEPVREALIDAHTAVERALSGLESLTDAVQVGLWPQRK